MTFILVPIYPGMYLENKLGVLLLRITVYVAGALHSSLLVCTCCGL